MAHIHHEVTFATVPGNVYGALMDSVEHAKFTGALAVVSTEAGGWFSAYGGRVQGRNVELVRNKRIVQAWRGSDWPDGVYSIVRFELHHEDGQTLLVFDQMGVPEDQVEHLDSSWNAMYWEPLRNYFRRDSTSLANENTVKSTGLVRAKTPLD